MKTTTTTTVSRRSALAQALLSSPPSSLLLLLLLPLLLVSQAHAFYLPSITPATYAEGDRVDLWLNKVFSDKTHLPYEYITLPVCSTTEDYVVENLGEILRGDRIVKSDYRINMLEDVPCRVLCTVNVNEKESKRLARLIQDDYKVEWILDNLPGATPYHTTETGKKQYEPSFKLGIYDEQLNAAYLHNHVTLCILYNGKKDSVDGMRIVGFEVYPRSLSSEKRLDPQGNGECPTDLTASMDRQPVGEKTTVIYTYSVEFIEEPNVEWSYRWDMYLVNSDPQIHWYSIVNSMIILMFLSAMVAIIMLRTLNNDISLYNEEELKEEQEEVTGWKLVHGDVFRPPKNGALLSVMLGSGVQFLGMILTTISFALLGILNPSYRGGMISFALLLFVFMGVFGGYYSARMYKTFKGTRWQRNAALTATVFPGLIFGVIFILNFFIWGNGSSIAIPFGTFVVLAVLWFCISTPLVFLGAYFGQKKKPIEHPVRTNQIPRQIPEVNWFLTPISSIIIGGLLPFAVIFIELFFIMKSVWQDQFYYMFGFLTLVAIILVISCVEITIVIVYFQLCSEDYHWWWRSFFVASSSTLYIFLYATFYFVTRLEIVYFIPGLLYFTYIFVACLIYMLCTGTIGFFACYYALLMIYNAVKVD